MGNLGASGGVRWLEGNSASQKGINRHMFSTLSFIPIHDASLCVISSESSYLGVKCGKNLCRQQNYANVQHGHPIWRSCAKCMHHKMVLAKFMGEDR